LKEAQLYQKKDDKKVQCLTCAHGCVINPGKRGICGVRENRDGKLYSLVYGKAIALHVDPIEKKPLFHFYPGTPSYSVATVGCNMTCLNCQNADISQMPRDQNDIEGKEMPPEMVVRSAKHYGCKTVAYTYTEPAVFWDYAYDTAKLAHMQNIKNIFVTNGFLSRESLEKISPYLDGANVDLKSFRDATYKSVCGARLKPVLETIRRMKDLNIWIEITTLLIPGLNDSEDELKSIAQFIAQLDLGIPWHVSRFYPTYRMQDRKPTPVSAIQKARRLGSEAGLRYVYAGNVTGDEGENTICYSCGTLLVKRLGFQIIKNYITGNRCPKCQTEIDGYWQ